MTNKIFRSTMFVAAVVLLCSVGIIMGVLYDYYEGVQIQQLKDELSLAVVGTEQNGTKYLQSVDSGRSRITWIKGDGTVLYDSQVAAETMGNHTGREEFEEAVTQGSGSSIRRSATLTEKTLYEARRLKDGTVLRISVSQAGSTAVMWGMMQPIGVIVVIAVALSVVLSDRMAKRIVQPLNRLDLENPLDNHVYEEISPLLNRINQQHQQISSQMRKLKRKTDEFQQITANLKEGLVLLDKEGKVLNINPAARKLFGADVACIGQDFLDIDRKLDMRNAIQRVFSDGYSQMRAVRNQREFQFDLSRIESGGSVIGAVILAFDVSEQTNAERSRREFSANVSHELKTPLQSIIGSAELMENGLVKPADQPRFIMNIRKEATRLVNLIEDIIRLSQLDEGVQIPQEEVELLPLAEETVAVLQSAADRKHVKFSIQAEPCKVRGVRRMLYEIIYNLCDNAIKYNVEGGSVTIGIRQENGNVVLSVADTGIGIPPEHQQRVFERFYRVDKSHSKQSGGTGLGLSIVKHAAMDHNAALKLQSTPGKGTTISVIF